MTIWEKIREQKEQREVIKTVEEAKLKKKKPKIEEELEKEADELVKELDITFDEALIYLRNKKKKEHTRKIAHERQERFTEKGKKILHGLENWGARATQVQNTKPEEPEKEPDSQPKTKSNKKREKNKQQTKNIEKPKPKPILRKREKAKNFFEICKEANK